MDARLEERYVVLKLKHLDELRRTELYNFLQDNGIPTVDCVVVEHDWPEYIPTVDAIMARMYAESLPDTLPPRIDQETPSVTYGELVMPPLARMLDTMTYQAKDNPVDLPEVAPINLEISMEVLPPEDGGREFFPYGRQALGRHKDVPWTCE